MFQVNLKKYLKMQIICTYQIPNFAVCYKAYSFENQKVVWKKHNKKISLNIQASKFIGRIFLLKLYPKILKQNIC